MNRRDGPLTSGFYRTHDAKITNIAWGIPDVPGHLCGGRTAAALVMLTNVHLKNLWDENPEPKTCERHCTMVYPLYPAGDFILGKKGRYTSIRVVFNAQCGHLRSGIPLHPTEPPKLEEPHSCEGEERRTLLTLEGCPSANIGRITEEDVDEMLKKMAIFLHHNWIRPDDFRFTDLDIYIASRACGTCMVILSGDRITPFPV
jgi:hypothetical protein